MKTFPCMFMPDGLGPPLRERMHYFFHRHMAERHNRALKLFGILTLDDEDQDDSERRHGQQQQQEVAGAGGKSK